MTTKITLSASQKTVVITFPAEGIALNFFQRVVG